MYRQLASWQLPHLERAGTLCLTVRRLVSGTEYLTYSTDLLDYVGQVQRLVICPFRAKGLQCSLEHYGFRGTMDASQQCRVRPLLRLGPQATYSENTQRSHRVRPS